MDAAFFLSVINCFYFIGFAAVGITDNKAGLHFKSGLAATSAFNKDEVWRAVSLMAYHAQALGFNTVTAHGRKKLRHALRFVHEAEASAGFQQKGCCCADIFHAERAGKVHRRGRKGRGSAGV